MLMLGQVTLAVDMNDLQEVESNHLLFGLGESTWTASPDAGAGIGLALLQGLELASYGGLGDAESVGGHPCRRDRRPRTVGVFGELGLLSFP